MAKCKYTYKGREYSEEAFKALLVNLGLPKIQKAYGFGLAEGKLTGEIHGFKEGIKQGIKEGKIKQDEISDQLVAYIKESGLKSGLTQGEVTRVLEGAVKVTNEKQLDRFLRAYNNIVYQRIEKESKKQKEDEAKTLAFGNRKKIKKAAKSKKSLSSDKGILKEFATLNPNKVSDINQYNEMAEAILNGVKGERVMENGEILNYIDKEKKQIKEKLKAEILEENSDLVASGLINDKMSLRDIQSVLEDSEAMAEKNAEAAEKRKEKKEQRIKDLKAKINSKAAILLDEVEMDDSSDLEKQVIAAVTNIDMSNLSEDNLNIMNRVIDNILVNGSFSNAGDLIVINQIQQATKDLKIELDKLGIESLEAFLNTEKGMENALNKLFKQGSLKIASTASVIDKIALSEAIAAVIRRVSGIQDLYSGHANVVTAMGEFNEKFKKQLDKDNQGYESQVRQALYSIVSQHYGGTQEDINKEFIRNKKLAHDSARKNAIESLHKLWHERVITEEQLEELSRNLLEGKITSKDLIEKFGNHPKADFSVLKIFETFIEPAQSADEVYKKLNESEKRIIEFLRDSYAEIQADLFESSLIFGNNTPEYMENYLPMVYNKAYYSSKIMGGKSIDEKISANSFISDDVINKSETGSTINRNKASNVGSEKVLSTDFHYDMLRKFREANYQIHTIAPRKAITKILNDKKFRSAINPHNAELLHKYAVRSVALQLNLFESDDFASSLMNILNKAARSGTRMALASPIFGKVKQMVPVYLGAVVKLGKYSNLMRTSEGLPGDIFKYSNLLERKETKAGFKSDFYINEKEMMAERNALKKGVLSLGKMSNEWAEYITDKMMGSITKGDSKIAERTWMGYYGKYRMKYDGVKEINWEYESKNPSKEASTYADQLVEKTQSTNSFSSLSEVLAKTRTANDIYRNIFIPFSTFVYNMRARLMSDMRQMRKQIMAGNFKEAGEAARDIAAVMLETTSFATIQTGIAALVIFGAQQALQFYGGYDDDEAEAMVKQMGLEDVVRRIGGTTLKDMAIGGIPGAEYGGSLAINSIYKSITGDEKNLVYSRSGRQDETFADLLGTYGIYMDNINNLVNDIDAMWISGAGGWSKGGLLSKAVVANRDLTDQEMDMYTLFLAHDVLKTFGISGQTTSGIINKIRQAVEKEMEADMGKLMDVQMVKPGERFKDKPKEGLSSGSLSRGGGLRSGTLK